MRPLREAPGLGVVAARSASVDGAISAGARAEAAGQMAELGTGSGIEASALCADEGDTAGSVLSLHCRDLVGSDVVGVFPAGVAAVAGRHEIVGGIVLGIEVDVVGQERVALCARVGFPDQRGLAPVAGVGSWSELLVEDGATALDVAALGGEWVGWHPDDAVAGHGRIVRHSFMEALACV